MMIHPPESLWSPHYFYLASDVWLLGVTFWEMFHIANGEAFGAAQNADELRELLHSKMIFQGGYVPLVFEGKIPKPLRDLIIWCCEFEFEKRPTPEDIIHRIEELDDGKIDLGYVKA